LLARGGFVMRRGTRGGRLVAVVGSRR
jgi:hypothetical protein